MLEIENVFENLRIAQKIRNIYATKLKAYEIKKISTKGFCLQFVLYLYSRKNKLCGSVKPWV